MTFFSSASATKQRQASQGSGLTSAVTSKRADRLIRGLRKVLAAQSVEEVGTSAPRVYGYGLAQVDTVRVFREITSDGRLHVVDVIAADEIDGVLAYVFENTTTSGSQAIVFPGDFTEPSFGFPGQIDVNGNITSGRYKNNGSQIFLKTGTPGQTAIPELTSRTSAENDFVGTGLAYAYSRWTFIEGRFVNGDPEMRVIARLRKPIDPRGGPQRWTFNPYVQLYDMLVKARNIGGAGLDPSDVNAANFSTMATWAEMLVDVQGETKTAFLSTDTNKASANHLLEFDQPVAPFQYGDVVNVVASAGQSIPSGYSPGVDYHVVPLRHRFGDFQVPAIALAATLEDALDGNFIAQGTRTTDLDIKKVKEVRFMSGFTYQSTDPPLEVILRMLESCGASLYLDDGKIHVTRQVFPGSVEAVTDGEVRDGSIALSNRLPSSERATSYTGTYTSLLNLFEPKDYPTRDGGGVFQVADNGISKPERFELPLVGKATAAQRLAAVALRRARQERVLSFSGSLSLYRLKPGTVFSLTHAELGLDANTTFEVRDQTIAVDAGEDSASMVVDIVARQLEATTFDLTSSDADLVESAKVPGLDSPFEVGTPGLPSIAESLFITNNGAGVKARATLTWSAPSTGFISTYKVSFKLSTDTDYTQRPPTADLTTRIDDIAAGTYDFRVIAVNTLGLESEPADVQQEILALSAPPSDPTNFTGQALGSVGFFLTWDQSTDLDVRFGGQVEIRHHSDEAGSLGADSILLATQDGNSTLAALSFKRGTYYIRFIDQSGNASGFAEFSADTRRPVPFGQFITSGTFDANNSTEDQVTIQEDPSFPSTNGANTLFEDTVNQWLELAAADNWDDITDVDAITNIDDVGGTGGVKPEGVYFYSSGIALNAVTRMIVETVLETTIVDESTSLDAVEDFDEIEDIDAVGANASQPGVADAWHEYRSTRDDPTGSPTWGPWQRIDTDQLNHRGVEFRVQARSFSQNVNIRISQARVIVRELPVDV